MTEPRKTPRTDAAERKCHDEEGTHHLVCRDDMSAIEIEAQELAEALRNTVAILEEWHTDRPDDIGAKEPAILSAANAALASHRAKQEVQP